TFSAPGSLAATEGPDIFRSMATGTTAPGTLAGLEQGDTFAGSSVGTSDPGTVTIDLIGDIFTAAVASSGGWKMDLVEGGDAFAGDGVLEFDGRAALAGQEQGDTFAAAGDAVPSAGTLAIQEGGDVFRAPISRTRRPTAYVKRPMVKTQRVIKA